jgi:hypothetical protein
VINALRKMGVHEFELAKARITMLEWEHAHRNNTHPAVWEDSKKYRDNFLPAQMGIPPYEQEA